jgi:cyclopropane-fatty-acyl-phospholipid synthase
MNTQSLTHALPARAPCAARIIFSFLGSIKGGMLIVNGPDGFEETYGHDAGGHAIRITLGDWDVLKACMKSGDIGFAETYMQGRWQCDDIPGLIKLFCRNRAAMEQAVYGSWFGNLLYRLKHLFNANTKAGSKKNIEAHYDLGNDFYRLWLDPSMTYSAALFGGDFKRSTADAQAEKYRRILRALGVKRGQHILEIGCGWGGFAETAIREFGVRVTGLTLSREQLGFANARLRQAGLSDHADLKLTDYRDLDAQFDHIVSIEMFEAVGEQYWDTYFAAVKRNLRPGGRAVVQSITIDESLFDRYRVGTDFIQQYIFPGGMLPSPVEFRARAARAGLATAEGVRFGLDYAETLRRWRAQFIAALPQVRELGFDTRFVRLWEFYLAYCEGAFEAGSTDVIQFDLTHA